MSARFNLVGQRFGRLVVLADAGNNPNRSESRWRCKCDCGNITIAKGYDLRHGLTVSCKCVRYSIGDRTRTHGQSHTREFAIWSGVLNRCTNKNHHSYHWYGARGITVCERWGTFEAFLEDMGNAPTAKHSLDRKENDKGYSPDNCRWATRKEQGRNKRNNVFVTINGQTKCVAEWEEALGLREGRLQRMMRAEREKIGRDTDRKPYLAFVRFVRTATTIRCYWCKRRVPKLDRHIDHIIPLGKGGRDVSTNVCCACKGCNKSKGMKTPEQFTRQYQLPFAS